MLLPEEWGLLTNYILLYGSITWRTQEFECLQSAMSRLGSCYTWGCSEGQPFENLWSRKFALAQISCSYLYSYSIMFPIPEENHPIYQQGSWVCSLEKVWRLVWRKGAPLITLLWRHSALWFGVSGLGFSSHSEALGNSVHFSKPQFPYL